MTHATKTIAALGPVLLLAACLGANPVDPSTDRAANTGTGTTGTTKDTTGTASDTTNPSGYYTPTARVRCEVRSNRSKISVDGNGLIPAGGTFTAKATSGANSATAPAAKAVGDEVEFDFDSDSGDIAEGAVAIAPNFIQNGSVSGQILNAAGKVVASATATCTSK